MTPALATTLECMRDRSQIGSTPSSGSSSAVRKKLPSERDIPRGQAGRKRTASVCQWIELEDKWGQDEFVHSTQN